MSEDTFAGVGMIVLALYAVGANLAAAWHRTRARNLAVLDEILREENQQLRRHVKATGRRIVRMRQDIDRFVDAADRMNECNAELERRNAWLEAKRYVILRRWWRRAGHRHQL